ncbi:lipase family protein [Agromyces sp. H66]|uniref:lipase family protein n=1 Tax=Agromyces sp. H66 TaxID=2529859 RepID=UPI0010AA9D2E|nr:lipase family protein [Agromyces sp. H66]
MSEGNAWRRVRALPRLVARAPWWVRVVVGAAAIVLGVLLVTRPLSSLAVLAVYLGLSLIVSGISDALDARGSATPVVGVALGLAWVLLGVAVLTWLGRSIDLLGPALAIALIVGGGIRMVRAVRGTIDERVASAILAAADIVFGIVALQWPDATLIVIAVLFGARTVFFGVREVWRGILLARGRRDRTDATRPRPLARFARITAAVVALAFAVVAAVVGSELRAGAPILDAFATVAGVPGEPGRLIRSEPFTRGIPDDAVAWRILYTTTDHTGEPVLSSGIVARAADSDGGPRPVIAWAHGTTGFAEPCAPSIVPDSLAAGALPALDRIISEDWVLVATDYAGLGTPGPQPYLVGEGEARSVLDAVRAARELDTVTLAAETVVWGHSQGGHAALWTGEIATGYAPDVPLAGVAAMAPASDPVGLTENLPNVPGGSVFASYVAAAYTAAYDDVRSSDYITPAAQRLVREMSTRCLSEPGVLVSVLTALSIERDRPVFDRDPTTGAFGARLDQNVPRGAIDAPLLVAQGLADPLVEPSVQDAYVRDRCDEGFPVDHRSYAGLGHLELVADDSPLIDELIDWTNARFAGEEPASTC